MPFPLIPFLAGAVVGAVATYLMRDRLPEPFPTGQKAVEPNSATAGSQSEQADTGSSDEEINPVKRRARSTRKPPKASEES